MTNVKWQSSADFENISTPTGFERASCFRICKLMVGKLRLKFYLSKAYFELLLYRIIYGIVPNWDELHTI